MDVVTDGLSTIVDFRVVDLVVVVVITGNLFVLLELCVGFFVINIVLVGVLDFVGFVIKVEGKRVVAIVSTLGLDVGKGFDVA